MCKSITGSAKRLNKKGCTSSRVSGPPRFSNNTPILSSPTSGVSESETSWVVEVTKAPKGDKCLLVDCLETEDCPSDHPREHLATISFFQWLELIEVSPLGPEQWYIFREAQIAFGNNLLKGRNISIQKRLHREQWNFISGSWSVLSAFWGNNSCQILCTRESKAVSHQTKYATENLKFECTKSCKRNNILCLS